eukprot:TRINITY_DN23827_c0_g1_i2.p1 TRINITY_DN23827_c0_g1~~TRINITY_DN23827_c0_g1_i2.p1  ORF type:complete len:679 (+),score=129.66 TRINITY_DN23827_c0_g1_i2:53-2089(+)
MLGVAMGFALLGRGSFQVLPGHVHETWCGSDHRRPARRRGTPAGTAWSVPPGTCTGPLCNCSRSSQWMHSVDCDDPEPVNITVTLDVHYGQDDGGGASRVTQRELQLELQQINRAFSSTGVQFTIRESPRRSTWHNSRVALDRPCRKGAIGDGHCDAACYTHSTGWDGGDCAYPPGKGPHKCWMTGSDGVCDDTCNYAQWDWDWGDCCSDWSTAAQTCRDPTHPNRSYWHMYDEWIGADPKPERPWRIHVYIVAFPSDLVSWFGVSTFPNDKEADFARPGLDYRNEGYVCLLQGVLGNPESTLSHALTHELGHVFGLYHTFRGESEADRFKVSFDGLLNRSWAAVHADVADGSDGGSHTSAEGPIRIVDPCNIQATNMNGAVAVVKRLGYSSWEWLPYESPSGDRFKYQYRCPNGHVPRVSDGVVHAIRANASAILVADVLPVSPYSTLGFRFDTPLMIPIRMLSHETWRNIEESVAFRTVRATVHGSNCSNVCMERWGEAHTGDFAADTRPTPLNFVCGEPVASKQNCSAHEFTDTPVLNVMSYTVCSDGNLPPKTFTRDQVRRIRCFADRYYRGFDTSGSADTAPRVEVEPPQSAEAAGRGGDAPQSTAGLDGTEKATSSFPALLAAVLVAAAVGAAGGVLALVRVLGRRGGTPLPPATEVDMQSMHDKPREDHEC